MVCSISAHSSVVQKQALRNASDSRRPSFFNSSPHPWPLRNCILDRDGLIDFDSRGVITAFHFSLASFNVHRAVSRLLNSLSTSFSTEVNLQKVVLPSALLMTDP